MPLDSMTYITVTATYSLLDDTPAVGKVYFESNQVLVGPEGVVEPLTFVAELDSTGSISIDLPATDDPDYEPTGWVYRVSEETTGRNRPTFSLSLPHDGGNVDLKDVAVPGPVDGTGLTSDDFTLLTTFNNHSARHASGGEDDLSDIYQQRGLIDVFASTDAATNDQRIADAQAKVTSGRPTAIRIVCHADQAGNVPISSAITLDQEGVWLTAEAPSSTASGVRLIWEGTSGATMVTVDAPRAGVANISLDAKELAANTIVYNGHRRQGYHNLTCESYTGTGLQIGNRTSNNNDFVGSGYCLLQGEASSRALYVNALSTENVALGTVEITNYLATGSIARAIEIYDGHTTIDELIVDDSGLADYAIFVRAGSLRAPNVATEVPQAIEFSNVARPRHSYVAGDFRSLSPPSGEYAMKIAGDPGDTTEILVLAARLLTADGATVAPDIYVNNHTIVGQVTFDLTTAGDPLGSFAPTSTGKVAAHTEDGLVLRNDALVVSDSAAVEADPGGVAADLLSWVVSGGLNSLILGENAEWQQAFYHLASGPHRFLSGGNELARATDSIADGETAMLVRRNVGGTLTLERVSMGLADSANVEHGSASIADTNSSVTVAHNLGVTPVVQVSPVGAYDDLHVTNKTTTDFVVNRPGTSGSQDFDWSAHGSGHKALRVPN